MINKAHIKVKVDPLDKNKVSKKKSQDVIFQEIEDTEIPFLGSYGKSKRIELGRGWLLSFDWHIPIHDIEMMKRLCRFGQYTFNFVEGLIVGGDFLNHDILGNFLDYSVPIKLSQEYDVAKRVLSILCKIFKKVIIMGGNHDYRWNRKMGGHLDVEFIYETLCRKKNFSYTRANRIEVGDDLIVCHPASSYSRIRCRVPSNIANKTGKNVMSGHTHHGGIVVADSNSLWASEPGAMLSIDKVEYYNRYFTNRPDFVNGFSVILPDTNLSPKPLVFIDGLTDWNYWMNKKW